MIFPRLSKATPPESTLPPAPVMVRFGPNVKTAPVPFRALPGWLPNRMVPGLPATPSITWAGPLKKIRLRVVPATLPRRRVAPFRVSPPVTLASTVLGAISSARGLSPAPVPSTVTPAKVPLPVTTRALPAAADTVPPLTVPPLVRFHEPGNGAAPKCKLAPALFRVPVRLMFPPVRVKVPSPVVAKVPPRLTAAVSFTSMVPLVPLLLLQVPAKVRVPPFLAPMVP